MKTPQSTITFIDSAYPKPHEIKEFIWSGRLDKTGNFGLIFTLKVLITI